MECVVLIMNEDVARGMYVEGLEFHKSCARCPPNSYSAQTMAQTNTAHKGRVNHST